MTQMDINFCILLLYVFLRNVMVFDIELAILYGFFNLRISKKITILGKSPNRAQNILFLNFYLILHQNAHNIVQNCQILCFKSI